MDWLFFMPSQLRRLKEVSRRALAYLLSQEQGWNIPKDMASKIAEASEESFLEVNEPLTLPSESKYSHHLSKHTG